MQIVFVLIAGAIWYTFSVHRALFKRHYHAGISDQEWRAMFWPSFAGFVLLAVCLFIPFVFAALLLVPIVGLSITTESASKASEERGKREREKSQED